MRLMVFLLFVLTSATACSKEPPKILIFGDSLSAGFGIDVDQSWPALLQTRLQRQGYEHQVVNASISGETTEGGVTRIAVALATFEPELLVLELGANDGLRGFPAARIEANLMTIIERAQASGAAVVLLGIRIPANYGPRFSREFEDVFPQVAQAADIPWLKFFMSGIASNEELLLDDRIHPNAKAQPRLLDNAWPLISATLQQ